MFLRPIAIGHNRLKPEPILNRDRDADACLHGAKHELLRPNRESSEWVCPLGPPGWTYRFAGNREAVPAELIGRDATRACADQLIKVARLLAAFLESFPQESCPHAAITPEGFERLGLTLDDVAGLLGLPSGYLDVRSDIALEEKLRPIRREIDPIDADAVRRLAAGQFLRGGEPLVIEDTGGRDLTDDIARLIETREVPGGNHRMVFLTAIGRRIQDLS